MSRRNNNEEEENKQPKKEEEAGSAGSSAAGKVTGRFGQLISTAAKLPTAYATGAEIELPVMKMSHASGSTRYEMMLGTIKDKAPGIMVYDWVPTIGVSTDNSSPANLAMAEIASFIKSQVNRRPVWETPDLAIAMLAIDSIYSLHFSLMRVYGLINRYSAMNKYWPRAIIESMGFDFDDFRNNQVNLLFMLQQRAAELRRLALPATFRLFERHLRFNSLIFADGETEKAQLYIFNQSCYWSYEVVDQVKGLTPIRLHSPMGDGEISAMAPDNLMTFASVVGIYDRMLTALRNSSDIDIIVGDIISAYGDAAISVVPEMAADYITPIVYDPAVLCSINNACIYNADTSSLRIIDKGGNYLYCQPRLTQSNTDGGWVSATVGNMPYLNFVTDVPSEADVVNAMLFHAWVDDVAIQRTGAPTETQDPVGYTTYKIVACGTELITNARLYVIPTGVKFKLSEGEAYLEGAAGGEMYHMYDLQQYLQTQHYDASSGKVVNDVTEVLLKIARLSAFKAHHPVAAVALVLDTSVPAVVTATTPFICSTQNRVPITQTNVQQLFTALLYDAFFN